MSGKGGGQETESRGVSRQWLVLFQVSGVVTDVPVPTVNLQFYRKNVSNQACEVYSAVQDKTANQARLLRIKDKTNPHNKLTNVTLSEPYQTTAVLVAEGQLEKVSREAVQIVSQNTKMYHLDENGAMVLDEIAIQPQGQDDMEQLEQGAHGTFQENEPGPEQQQSDQ